VSIDTDLQTYLTTLAYPTPVQQNVISADQSTPRVWYQRKASNQDTFTDGSKSVTNSVFAVEVMSLDIDQAEAIAQTIKDASNGFFGHMGFTYVGGCTVEEMEQDYEPKNLGADVGFHVAAFNLHLIHM
jgi:hypothetical protein